MAEVTERGSACLGQAPRGDSRSYEKKTEDSQENEPDDNNYDTDDKEIFQEGGTFGSSSSEEKEGNSVQEVSGHLAVDTELSSACRGHAHFCSSHGTDYRRPSDAHNSTIRKIVEKAKK